MSIRIWANHAHIFQAHIRPNATVDELLKYIDEAGIEHAVAFAPFPGPQSEGLADRNEWLAEQLVNRPELTGFGTVDFNAKDISADVAHIAELGFKGIKIHPQYQWVAIDGEKMIEACSKAAELGLFVTFHSGVHFSPLKETAVWLFDSLSYACPTLRYSMEHVGGYCHFREALGVILNAARRREPQRVFAGLTSVFTPGGWYLSDSDICDLVNIAGEDIPMFGLDFPYNNPEYAKNAIKRILSLDISDNAKELILGGNLRRELGYA